MNRDEVIALAQEAGAEFAELPMTDAIVFSVDDRSWNSAALLRFAALVAAHEREECIDIVAMHGGSVEIEAAIRSRT